MHEIIILLATGNCQNSVKFDRSNLMTALREQLETVSNRYTTHESKHKFSEA